MRRSERAFEWTFLLLAAAVLPFCGGQSSDSGSSESHFLVPCDATCAEGLSCVCGVCSVPCDASTTCASYGAAASCVPPTCDENVALTGLCDVLCETTADCASLGNGYTCAQGRCRATGGSGGSCGPATAQAVRDFVAENQGCSADADCVRVDTPCFAEDTCAAATPLRKDYDADKLDALLSELARCAGDCASCDIGLPPPACVDGTCQFGGGVTDMICEERSSQASQTVQQAVESADRTCATNADCVAVSNSSDCYYSCGAIVSVTGAEAVQAAIDELNGGLCATFTEDGCTAFAPPCPFPGEPECIVGECVAGLRSFGAPCSDACGNQCYVPGLGGPGICSGECSTDADCEPTGVCQRAGGAGKWCFRRCASDAECVAVNGDAANPLYCARRLDPESSAGFEPLAGTGEGFCIQSSEP